MDLILRISGIILWVIIFFVIIFRLLYGKDWYLKAGLQVFFGKGLINSFKKFYTEFPNEIKKSTLAELSAHIIWRITRIGILALIITSFPIFLLLQQNELLKNQNNLFENQNLLFESQNNKIDNQILLFEHQNRRIDEQTTLLDSQIVLFSTQNILFSDQNDKIDFESQLMKNQNRLVEKQFRLNEQVDKGKIDIIDVYLLGWNKYSREEAFTIEWGYDPNLYAVMKDKIRTDEYYLTNSLVFIDTITKEIVSNPCFTVSELENELNRLLEKGQTSGFLSPVKQYQIQFDFKNIGNTKCKLDELEIYWKEEEGQDFQLLTNSKYHVTLSPYNSFNYSCYLFVPIFKKPKFLYFKVNLNYDENEGEETLLTYDFSRNYWTY